MKGLPGSLELAASSIEQAFRTCCYPYPQWTALGIQQTLKTQITNVVLGGQGQDSLHVHSCSDAPKPCDIRSRTSLSREGDLQMAQSKADGYDPGRQESILCLNCSSDLSGSLTLNVGYKHLA